MVIRLQSHGDVLLTTFIFSALKHCFPGIEADAMVFAETLLLLAANSDLAHVWALPRGHRARCGLSHLRTGGALMPQIRRRRYDWVLHLNDQWLGAATPMVSGAALRFDYETQKCDYWLWGEIIPQRIVPTADGHMVEQNMRVLQAPDGPLDPEDMRYTIAVSPADEALSQQKLASSGVSGGFVPIHPTSRWLFKCWEDDRFAEVIAVLAASGRQVVLTSAPGPREVDLVDALLQRVGNPKVVSLAGRLTLPALAATIAGATVRRCRFGADAHGGPSTCPSLPCLVHRMCISGARGASMQKLSTQRITGRSSNRTMSIPRRINAICPTSRFSLCSTPSGASSSVSVIEVKGCLPWLLSVLD